MFNDGYTFAGSVDGMRFHYRPILSDERRQIFRAASHYGDFDASRVVVACMTRHLIVWDRPALISVKSVHGMLNEQPTPFADVLSVMVGVSGEWCWRDEAKDESNLRLGIRLATYYPDLAKRDCAYCERYMYDDVTGEVYKRRGVPQERPASHPAPCRTHMGCYKGTPEEQRVLSDRNRLAYAHYRECVAVGSFPDDAVVRHNARIIFETLRDIEQEREVASGNTRTVA